MSSGSKAVLLTGVASLAALAFLGCERDDIHAYRAPKTVRATPPQTAPAPAHAEVAWDPPEGWRTVTVDQPMRIATFRAGPGDGVEVSVTAFPGDVGGLLANVNRWRGQVGLGAVDVGDLVTQVKSVDLSDGSKASVVDVTGVSPSTGKTARLYGLIVPRGGKTW